MFKKNIDKILESVKYKKELNTAKTEQIKTEYSLINADEQLREIKNKVKLINSIKISGVLLYVLSFIGLVASTSLSLAGGYRYYTGIALYAFIVAVCFVQLVIFKISTLETILKTKFRRHYWTFKLLQLGLLTVSIYFNYLFFMSHSEISNKYITLLLCILLDVSVIKFVSLAYDKRMLNFDNFENVETQSIFYMIAFNMLFKLRFKALKQYKDNVKTLKQEVSKDKHVKTDVLKDERLKEKDSNVATSAGSVDSAGLEQDVKRDNVINLDVKTNDVKRNVKTDDVKTNSVKSHLVLTYKSGDKVDVKMLKESFNMSARAWQKVKNDIPELVTKGTNTYFRNRKEGVSL